MKPEDFQSEQWDLALWQVEEALQIAAAGGIASLNIQKPRGHELGAHMLQAMRDSGEWVEERG